MKKFPSNRSFSVASLTPKLNKLPEMATNIRRRMSNQFAQAGHQVGVDLYFFSVEESPTIILTNGWCEYSEPNTQCAESFLSALMVHIYIYSTSTNVQLTKF